MKRLCLSLVILFSFSIAYGQDQRIPYLLYAKTSGGLEISRASYVYTTDQFPYVRCNKTNLPSSQSQEYANYEWFFIPVGNDEPGKYYLRNAQGKYLGYLNSAAMGAYDDLGEDGFKFFICRVSDSSDRVIGNAVRLYLLKGGKLYSAYSDSDGRFVLGTKPSNHGTFYITHSREGNLAFNGNMELIYNYDRINLGSVAPAMPITDMPDFSLSQEGASFYFPMDFNRVDGTASGSGARLLHSNYSSGNQGYYFVRLKTGDKLSKVIDNPLVDGDCVLKIQLKVRSTMADVESGTITLLKNETPLAVESLSVPLENGVDQNYHDPLSWHSHTFYVSVDQLDALTELEVSCLLGEGGFLDVDDIRVSIVDDIPAKTLYWSPGGGDPTAWNEAGNWVDIDNNSLSAPDKSTDVVLRSGQTAYPLLAEDEVNQCGGIYFEAGAQLGNQFYLDYDRAGIQLQLNTMQWYALSAPLHGMFSGDYLFERVNPLTEMRLFHIDHPARGMYYADWSASIESAIQPLDIAFPYNVRIGKIYYDTIDEVDGADPESRRILLEAMQELPKDNLVFNHYDAITKIGTGVVETLSLLDRKWSHRFIYERETDGQMSVPSGETLSTIATGIEAGEAVIMLGNPLMSALDFGEFYYHNSELIYPEFRLLIDGTDYITYSGLDNNRDGIIDSAASTDESLIEGMIPPMTAFAVRTREDYEGSDLVLTKSMSRVHLANTANYRTETDLPIQQLRIECRQDGLSGQCLLLFSDQYTDAYLPEEDSRKMNIAGLHLKPLVYSVAGDQYIEVNRLKPIDDPLVLGISLPGKGSSCLVLENLLSLEGANRLALKDRYTGKEIPFEGKDRIEYLFDSDAGDYPDRFSIINHPVAIQTIESPDAVCFVKDRGGISIRSSRRIEDVNLYSSDGCLLYKLRENLTDPHCVYIDLASITRRVLIVRVITSGGFLHTVKLLL